MKTKLRVGVIGAGQIVENSHLPTLCSRGDIVVAWITDVNRSRSDQMASMYGIPAIDQDHLYSRLTQVDVCLIATPLGVREPYIDACRQAGVAAYVEKPFARTLEEHDRYCTGFSPERIAVGYQRRTYQSLNLLRNALRQQLFGRPQSLTCSIGGYTLRSGGSSYLSDTEMAGGGVLIELGIHVLDQVIQLFDPFEIKVKSARAFIERRQEFHLTMESEFETDCGVLPISGAFSRLLPQPNEFLVECEHAWLRTGIAPDSPVSVRSKVSEDLFTLQSDGQLSVTRNASTSQQAFSIVWDAFLKGLREKLPNLSSATSSRMTTKWLQDVYGCSLDG